LDPRLADAVRAAVAAIVHIETQALQPPQATSADILEAVTHRLRLRGLLTFKDTNDAYAAALAVFKPLVTGSGGGGSFTSADATSSQTTLWKNATTSFFGGASYKTATTSGTITDTYTTATSTNWVMVAIALRPATSTSAGGGASGSTTVRYVHTDNLGGSSVITDQQGSVSQAQDFYPYGATRIDTKSGGYAGEKRKFAGTEYDSLSGLNYAMARYQSPTRGQFISEDPIFLAIGDQNKLQRLGLTQQALLADPQLQNSYSWGRDNPITQNDPTGLYPGEWFFRGIDTLGNALFFGNTVPNAIIKSPGETPQQTSSDRAQLYLDGSMYLAGVYAGSMSPPGVALNVGGLVLMGTDKYCETSRCANFEGAQYIPAGAILDSIPKPHFGTSANKSSTAYQNSFGGSTLQQRQATVSAYNTTASGNQDKLWVTPNGAIVTWTGDVKAPAIVNSSNGKK
jgi:RHS repeat-associated protein